MFGIQCEGETKHGSACDICDTYSIHTGRKQADLWQQSNEPRVACSCTQVRPRQVTMSHCDTFVTLSGGSLTDAKRALADTTIMKSIRVNKLHKLHYYYDLCYNECNIVYGIGLEAIHLYMSDPSSYMSAMV